MSIFDGKKLILLGDEAGISLEALRGVLKNSGGEVVYEALQCFV